MRTLYRSNAQVQIYSDPNELALNAARHFEANACDAVSRYGRFTVALSGGATPRALFAALASEPFSSNVPWASTYIFWADERCVPATDPESNFRMASESLLSKVPVPSENVFRVPTELQDSQRIAESYSATLRQFFISCGSIRPSTAPLVNFPRFDLVLLGMGADGHTASLFPQTPALDATSEIVVANYVAKLKSYRITLTTTTINNSRDVTFLVAGEGKAQALKAVLEGEYRPALFPSQLISPRKGNLIWLVDEAAASLLET